MCCHPRSHKELDMTEQLNNNNIISYLLYIFWPLRVRTSLLLFYTSISTSLTGRASLMAQLVKNPLAIRETWVQSLGWEDPLEKGKANHSTILAWRIPWTTIHGVTKNRTGLSNFHFLYRKITLSLGFPMIRTTSLSSVHQDDIFQGIKNMWSQ